MAITDLKCSIAVVGCSLAALSVGCGVYLLDRPPGTTWLIPSQFSLYRNGQSWLGALNGWLPSFGLTFFACIQTCLAIGLSKISIVGSCALWLLLNSVLELLQHPVLKFAFRQLEESQKNTILPLNILSSYARSGTFDVADLLATVSATMMAAILLCWAVQVRRDRRGEIL